MKKYYLINQEVYPVSTPEEGIRIFMDDPFTHGLSIDEFKKLFKKNQEKLGIKVPATALKDNTSFWNHMIKTKIVTLATPTEKKLLNNENKPERAKKISGIASSKTISGTSVMLDGYKVEFFKTAANVYANIYIPSDNPTWEDDTQIKGQGKTEKQALADLKRNYEKYKKNPSSEGIRSTPKRKWSVEDPVLFRNKVWYLKERNGKYGLVNFDRTVTGDFIPLFEIKYPEITTITDMYGKPVDVNRNLSKVPVGNVRKNTNYQVYHKSYSGAVRTALEYAESKGYKVVDEDVWNKISMGKKKPSEGKTNRFSIGLTKGGKDQKKMLHVQIYGMKNSYELNAYIN